jgi:serine/threonine protein kinase
LERARGKIPFLFWTPTGKAIITCGIALGMRFLHSLGYVHGHLTPSNIVINAKGDPLVGDLSAVRREFSELPLIPLAESVFYAAPESFEEDHDCTDRADVFSFGSIVYEIVTEQAVFPRSSTPLDVIAAFRRGQLPDVPGACGSLMQSLIRRCWSADPAMRPSFDRIIEIFQAEYFNIVPGASACEVRDYYNRICCWESESCCPAVA